MWPFQWCPRLNTDVATPFARKTPPYFPLFRQSDTAHANVFFFFCSGLQQFASSGLKIAVAIIFDEQVDCLYTAATELGLTPAQGFVWMLTDSYTGLAVDAKYSEFMSGNLHVVLTGGSGARWKAFQEEFAKQSKDDELFAPHQKLLELDDKIFSDPLY